jgi:hypothetical protein
VLWIDASVLDRQMLELFEWDLSSLEKIQREVFSVVFDGVKLLVFEDERADGLDPEQLCWENIYNH